VVRWSSLRTSGRCEISSAVSGIIIKIALEKEMRATGQRCQPAIQFEAPEPPAGIDSQVCSQTPTWQSCWPSRQSARQEYFRALFGGLPAAPFCGRKTLSIL